MIDADETLFCCGTENTGITAKPAGADVRYLDPRSDFNQAMESDTEQRSPMIGTTKLPAEVTQFSTLPPGGQENNRNQQAKMANENPSPTGFLAWAGFGCAIFGLACLCVSFASPYWMQTYPNSFNTFRNIGLWEVCMDNYMHHKDDSQEIYSGCWWVFSTDKKYKKLREWLLPRKYFLFLCFASKNNASKTRHRKLIQNR